MYARRHHWCPRGQPLPARCATGSIDLAKDLRLRRERAPRSGGRVRPRGIRAWLMQRILFVRRCPLPRDAPGPLTSCGVAPVFELVRPSRSQRSAATHAHRCSCDRQGGSTPARRLRRSCGVAQRFYTLMTASVRASIPASLSARSSLSLSRAVRAAQQRGELRDTRSGPVVELLVAMLCGVWVYVGFSRHRARRRHHFHNPAAVDRNGIDADRYTNGPH